MASEASYVYILSGQKFTQIAQNGSLWKTWRLGSNSVSRLVNFNRAKLDGKCPNSKIQRRYLGLFSNTGLHDDLGLFSFPHKYLTNEAISSTFVQLIPKGRRSIL